jgi:hypothetical protein
VQKAPVWSFLDWITDHTCIQYSVYSGVSIWEPDLLLRVLTRVVSESGEFA